MAVPPLVNGRLPLGRWPATPAEVAAAFVTGQTARRQAIWQDLLQLIAVLRDVVPALPAVWLSGSFLTDKLEPNDVDCVFVIEAQHLLRATLGDPREAAFLQAVATSQVRSTFGLSVDSYILEWVPRPGHVKAFWAADYLESRGYWDDLWSRERSLDEREDSVPRRGYVEVILDGYA